MTAFLWTAVILMGVALLGEIFAFVGMAIVATRASRRATELSQQISKNVQASVRLVNELKVTLQPHVQTITEDSREMGSLLTSRFRAIQAVCSDSSRRAERIRLRLNDSVQTVDQHRRGVQREVAEPIQAASHVLRGLRLAFWFLRKVA